MELCKPFEGWHLDEEGTIHTPSGYRCTPQLIEGALWMFGMLQHDYAKHFMRSDTSAGATVPAYRIEDIKDDRANAIRIQIAKHRQCENCGP